MKTTWSAVPASSHDGHSRQQSPAIYLRRCNGTSVDLINRAAASSRLAQLSRTIGVSGTLDGGFGWSHPGSIPPTRYSITPLPAPYMPFGGGAVIELWSPPTAESGRWSVRRFRGELPDAMTLYLVACCLWSTPDTGRDATHAVIYGPDGQPFAIDRAASTCGQVLTRFVDLMRGDNDAPDTFTSNGPPPGWLPGARL